MQAKVLKTRSHVCFPPTFTTKKNGIPPWPLSLYWSEHPRGKAFGANCNAFSSKFNGFSICHPIYHENMCLATRHRQKFRGVVDVDWMWLISIRGISINSAIRVWLKSIRAFFCLFPWLKSMRAVIEINQGGFQSGVFTFNHVLDWNEVVTIVTIVYFQSRSRLKWERYLLNWGSWDWIRAPVGFFWLQYGHVFLCILNSQKEEQ